MPVRPTTAPKTRLLGELGRVVADLRGMLGLEARIIAAEPQTKIVSIRPDAIVEITTGNTALRYVVDVRLQVDRPEVLEQLQRRLATYGERGLVFTPYMAPTLANECRKIDLQFLDTAGNAYLHAPGFYVFIKGQKAEKWAPANKGGGGTATALRIIFALLNNRELQTAPYREIANAAGVALGAVGRVFDDLVTRGYITLGKRDNRRILERARLFDEWATNYPIRLRPKLNPRRFRAPITDWWGQTQLDPGKAWWGGEVAADRLTNYLKAETCTIYIDPAAGEDALNDLVREHRLRADPNGNVEVLTAFWNLPPNPAQPDVVPPMLVYADLVATLDPRNLEVAKLIRERFIDDPVRTP